MPQRANDYLNFTILDPEAVQEIGKEQGNDLLINPGAKTPLFGTNLDSVGVVTLVAEIEERVSEELKIDIILADEKAMSQQTSP